MSLTLALSITGDVRKTMFAQFQREMPLFLKVPEFPYNTV